MTQFSPDLGLVRTARLSLIGRVVVIHSALAFFFFPFIQPSLYPGFTSRKFFFFFFSEKFLRYAAFLYLTILASLLLPLGVRALLSPCSFHLVSSLLDDFASFATCHSVAAAVFVTNLILAQKATI